MKRLGLFLFVAVFSIGMAFGSGGNKNEQHQANTGIKCPYLQQMSQQNCQGCPFLKGNISLEESYSCPFLKQFVEKNSECPYIKGKTNDASRCPYLNGKIGRYLDLQLISIKVKSS